VPRLKPAAAKQLRPVSVAVLLAILAGIIVVVLIVHWPVLSANALCFDDPEYLVENTLVRHPSLTSAWQFISEVFEPSTVHGYYQPLTMISLMLDYAVGGQGNDLFPFHLTSLVFHICNTMLVTWLMYRLFGNVLAAGLLGLIFGLHPMAVESIAWIAQRKTLLAAFFALWSLVMYVQYARSGRRIWYISLTVMFILALLSKPTATPLPVCMLLMDYWPLKRLNKRAILEKIPLLMIAIASAIITFESQRRTAAAALPTETPPWQAPLSLCYNTIFYLRQTLWPTSLSAHYTFPSPFDLSNIRVLVGLAGTFILIVLLTVSLRWTRVLLFGWLWFFVAIFPSMGVISFTNVIAADRFLYLPVVGLLMPIGYFLARLLSQTTPTLIARHKIIAVVLSLVFAGSLAVRTRSYLHQWDNTEKLFRYMLHRTPDAPAVHFFLASELDDQGRTDEAIKHYRKVMALVPGYAKTYLNLGVLLFDKGQVTEARSLYEHALEINPDYAEVCNNMGNILYRQGQIEQARQRYEQALKLWPDYSDARCNLANLLAQRGDLEQAAQNYRQVLERDPDHGPAHQNLGSVMLQQGNIKECLVHYREALRCRPRAWQLANNIAWLYATNENPEIHNPREAIRFADLACRLTGYKHPMPFNTLAVAYAEANRLDIARQTALKAIQLAREQGQPQFAEQIKARMLQYKIEIAPGELGNVKKLE